ncbi:MAG: nitroreductase [Sphaerochaetaceae bacterium]|nr:nitroreductase [Sphaerochaetaceae bacterium]MDD2406160.1 nitroreductase [Sphaerochaetaceae bacterium]MDD4259201.1 nitroreductase [Sphaerochaetaceae bacterium]MDD4842088.1 nitroreductase [Sphaerochaetaceae bacterium]NLO60804.1 nitroreductase family protein [Spirochaetales bacterium]
MNETINTLMTRQSVRSFKDTQIEEGDLKTILEAGLKASTAMNRQSWHFTVVQNRDLLDTISQAVAQVMRNTEVPSLVERASQKSFSCFHHAPTVIFLSSDKTIYSLADCANAAQNMCVAATALSLGSCYVASFAQAFSIAEGKKLLGSFNLPEGYEPVFSVALGYTEGSLPPAKTREWKVSYIR